MDLRKVSCLLFFCLIVGAGLGAESYSLQKGDSLTSLAQKWKLPLESVRMTFPEVNWDKPLAGTKLQLPEKHTVAAGETLYSLARKWDVEVAALAEFNGIVAGKALRVGTVLWAPPPSPPSALDVWPLKTPLRAEGGRLKSVSFLSPGADFLSVSDGTVVFQGEYRGVGRVILVEAEDKTIYGYGNFEQSAVEFGQKVKKGQILGKSSSRSTERLIFFASLDGEAVDLTKVGPLGKS